jgi:biotin transport system substrate-specific component
VQKGLFKHQGFQLVISLLLLCGLGPLAIPLSQEISFTLQTFFVLLPAVLFGWKLGLLNVIIYLFLGSAGLPVFAGYTSGFSGPSIGYLVAFIPAVMAIGYWGQKHTKPSYLFLFMWLLLAHLFIITIGLGVQLFITQAHLNQQQTLCIKLLVGALVKSVAGALLVIFIRAKLSGGLNQR